MSAKLRAVLALASICTRSIFAGRRLTLTMVLFLLPPALSLLIGATARGGFDHAWAMHGVSLRLVLSSYVIVLALIHGLSLSSGEIEEGTAVYVFLGILPRWAVLLVRFAVTATLLSALTLGSLALSGLSVAATMGARAGELLHLAARYGIVSAVAIGCYLAFFLFCGYAFRRPVAVGISATILWEIVVTFFMPMKFAAYTLTNNLYGLALSVAMDGQQGRWFRYRRGSYEIPSYQEASLYVSVFLATFLVAAMIAVMNRSIEGREAR